MTPLNETLSAMYRRAQDAPTPLTRRFIEARLDMLIQQSFRATRKHHYDITLHGGVAYLEVRYDQPR